MSPQTTSPLPGPVLSRPLAIALALILEAVGAGLVFYGFTHGWGVPGWAGVVVISFSPMIVGRLAAPPAPTLRPAMRRYMNRLLIAMAVYVPLLMIGIELYERGLTAGPLGYLVAILPALPVVGIFMILARFIIEETDEVQRHITLTALVWSGVITFSEATLWGFLETFGKAPHVWMWAVPVAFCAQFGLTMPLAMRKYR